tara:strand:- start:1144 stop:1401 length:258 start_codon:yes stop_codon:yes gene_type:complete
MEWLKSQLARWKVQVSFVAGALVVATTYGTCTVEPPAVEVSEANTTTETVETTTNTVEVSETTTTTNENTGNSTETTTTTETISE